MSSPPTLRNERASNFELPDQRGVGTAVKKLLAPVQFVGFWSAVALPFGYLPLLYGSRFAPSIDALGPLLVLNLVAMLVGHGYKSD